MCTNFTPIQKPQWVKDAFGVDLPSSFPPETYPGFVAPIVVQSHQTARVACGLAKFGLIPGWAKDEKTSPMLTTLGAKQLLKNPATEQHGVSVNMVWYF